MKKVSVLIPCFNEQENIEAIVNAIGHEFEVLGKYEYEIVFIDNSSTDNTKFIIQDVCAENKKVKAIFNAANFGQNSSPYYGMCQCKGDCVIAMACDFQDPPSLIPEFLGKWEEGHRIVGGIKSSSRENAILYFFRSTYYKILRKVGSVNMIEHFTGFGLFDRSFILLMSQLDDSLPFLRGVIAEYGEAFNMAVVEFEQPKRRAGKTKNNFWTLYDIAMLSFTSYTKVGLRIATFIGFISAGISFIIALVYLIIKLVNWDSFDMGQAPIVFGVFLIGGIQLVFLGLIGEYILNINKRVINRPLVVEEKRINFEKESDSVH